jgi:hypothetical protein
VPNVDWGLLSHEADLVALAPSDYLYEVEIKISVADLKRDGEKWHHKLRGQNPGHEKVRAFWYAMPLPVWQKVAADPPLLAYAGAITVDGSHCAVVRKPQLNHCARKLTNAERMQLGRLGTMRYWTRLSHKHDVVGVTA